MDERANQDPTSTKDEIMSNPSTGPSAETAETQPVPMAASPATAPTDAPTSWTATAVAPRAPRRVRVGSVVWGVVVVAFAVGLVAFANGAVFDVQLAGIVLVAAAGVALLAGSLASARRRA